MRKSCQLLALCIRNIGCAKKTKNFFPHLDKFKAALYVGKRIKGGVVVVGLLDSRHFDVQAFFFIFTMSHNVKTVM
jgi:hypothetical protein